MLQRINDVFYRATMSHYTAHKLSEALCREIVGTKEYQTLPYYAREYLRGYVDAKRDMLWHDMVFSYEIDGKRLSIDSVEYKAYMPEYVCTTALHSGAYVWKSDTSKFYTVPENTIKTA